MVNMKHVVLHSGTDIASLHENQKKSSGKLISLEKKSTKVTMQIFEKYTQIPDEARGGVLVIGNFDGVHKGHAALLEHAHKIAQEKGTHVAALTFEPHPRVLFRPDDPPFRITPAPLKAGRLREHGVAGLFSLPFDWDFASQSADHFVQHILIEGIQPAHVVVGYNFRFGQLRKGSPETIKDAGIPVTIIEEVLGEEDECISSTDVRQALRHGRLHEANKLLGWNWEIWGTVVKGDQRGRELGYPTANFALGEGIVHPAYGVYAARVQIEGEQEWHGAAINIGIKPMFEVPKAEVESHILDFSGDLYGKLIKVQPVQFLRGEAKFNSLEELIAQMDQDCQEAREILKGKSLSLHV